MRADREPLFRHSGAALLRAAAAPLDPGPGTWPALSDTESCRAWLTLVWSRPGLAEAIRRASPTLADRLDAIHAGRIVEPKRVRRAAASTVRYVLRATGRHTPFGLFAGVAPASVGSAARLRWGEEHRAVARADTQWLADVVRRLEACPDLLERLDVVFTNLAAARGGRLEAPHGPDKVSVRFTSAVRAARDAAKFPIRFSDLADKVAEGFPAASRSTVRTLLTELVQQGLLLTCLRAPLTVTDPLGYVIERLDAVGAYDLPVVAPLLGELRAAQADVYRHNRPDTTDTERPGVRARAASRMRGLSRAGRTPLAVDLRLDADVQVPAHVAREMEQAASALMRLSRQPTGEPSWRDFYTAFRERYGTGTLVPVADVVDPDAGLGLPAGYPDSVLTSRSSAPSERDKKLLGLAWTAMADGTREIVSTKKPSMR